METLRLAFSVRTLATKCGMIRSKVVVMLVGFGYSFMRVKRVGKFKRMTSLPSLK